MANGLFDRLLYREKAPRPEGESRFVAASATEASRRHERNEDASFADAETGLIGLADGVSGGGSGDEASRMAMDALKDASSQIDRMVDAARRDRFVVRDLGTRVGDAMEAAARQVSDRVRTVVERYRAEGRPERPHTTFIMAKLYEREPGAYEASVVRVGNSRAYVLRADGNVERAQFAPPEATGKVRKHELIETFLQKKRLDAREVELLDQATSLEQLMERWNAYHADTGMPGDETFIAAAYKQTYKGMLGPSGLQVMGSIPSGELHVGRTVIKGLRPGDRVVLVSDGISDAIPEMDMSELLQGATTPEEVARRLKDEAVRVMRTGEMDRAKEDDATVQVMEVAGGSPTRSGTRFPRRGRSGESLARSVERIMQLVETNLTPELEREVEVAKSEVAALRARR
ncbi:hypothetical protein EBS80_03165, partial [bacterium]|nr:hypothetical protein [bacterium]